MAKVLMMDNNFDLTPNELNKNFFDFNIYKIDIKTQEDDIKSVEKESNKLVFDCNEAAELIILLPKGKEKEVSIIQFLSKVLKAINHSIENIGIAGFDKILDLKNEQLINRKYILCFSNDNIFGEVPIKKGVWNNGKTKSILWMDAVDDMMNSQEIKKKFWELLKAKFIHS